MKTLMDLQHAVGHEQTTEALIEYLSMLIDEGVLTPLSDGEMVRKDGEVFISDRLFKIMAGIYGIQLNADLTPVKPGL
ncbi:hypothetical protein PGS49_21800 [Yersinia intermedia]|uniref:hypothetical protein n=1 Tax=Yersinia intermedia TaxID=631 RepID=UPI0022FE2080|nr:hypothetical protein [Yersinia intermedia]MDA5483250.1 hypothetical protein [Yersinia intermedia]